MSEDEVAAVVSAASRLNVPTEWAADNRERVVVNAADLDRLMDAVDALAALSGVPEGAASERSITVRDVAAAMGVNVSDIPVPSPEPLDVEEVARRIHRSKDGCNGRPHTNWFRGPNKCLRLARLAAPQPVPEDAP